jgi:hypothetical protein
MMLRMVDGGISCFLAIKVESLPVAFKAKIALGLRRHGARFTSGRGKVSGPSLRGVARSSVPQYQNAANDIKESS